MPKVSIILPIYNVEQYLVECLNSVCAQTLKDIEIICVNDGSTDSSLDIVNSYAEKDNRIVVLTGPNGGYGKAMNKGLDRATGEYIGIVEPDDYVAIEMYETLYASASANNLDWVKADFFRFGKDDNGDVLMKYFSLDSTGANYGKLLNPGNNSKVFRFVMNTWSGIYKREFIEKYHIRHNETPGASFQDNGFFFQTMIYAKRAMILRTPLYRNRRDNPNSSVKNTGKVYCMNVEYDHIKDILLRDQAVWDRFREIYYWKKYVAYDFTVSRISFEFKLPYIKHISSEFNRAYKLGDFTSKAFSDEEWEKLSLLMSSPEGYFEKYALYSDIEISSQRKYNALRNSLTYKTGAAVLYIPKKIRDLLARFRNK